MTEFWTDVLLIFGWVVIDFVLWRPSRSDERENILGIHTASRKNNDGDHNELRGHVAFESIVTSLVWVASSCRHDSMSGKPQGTTKELKRREWIRFLFWSQTILDLGGQDYLRPKISWYSLDWRVLLQLANFWFRSRSLFRTDHFGLLTEWTTIPLFLPAKESVNQWSSLIWN